MVRLRFAADAALRIFLLAAARCFALAINPPFEVAGGNAAAVEFEIGKFRLRQQARQT
jgi:hypothetical protein